MAQKAKPQPLELSAKPHTGYMGYPGQATWLDAARRYPRVRIATGRQIGKALAVDTPIPTPRGLAPIGELRVGDAVFDELGQPCRVTNATEVMHGRPCYRVTFSDGAEVVADADHTWVVDTKRSRKARRAFSPRSGKETLTTAQMSRSVMYRDESNYSIPVTLPLQYPEADLPIHPYALGVWLGDGHSASNQFTVDAREPDIPARLEACGVELGAPRQYHGTNAVVRTLGHMYRRGSAPANDFRDALRECNLLGNKHIPEAYMRASVEQRVELLRGLMDTDGCITKRGVCEFTQVDPRLANEVFDLILSLGFQPTMSVSPATLNGRVVGTRHRITFHPLDRRVFHMERKWSRQRPCPRRTRTNTRYITSITPVPSVPVRCIEVDSPSHLFLCSRHLIPTHNSTFWQFLLLDDMDHFNEWSPRGGEYYAAYAAQGHPQASTRFEADLETFESAHLVKRHRDKGQDRWIKLHGIGKCDGATIYYWSFDPEAHTSAQGKSLHRGFLDEASLVPYEAYTLTLVPMFNATQGRDVIAGTPIPGGLGFAWFEKEWQRGNPRNPKPVRGEPRDPNTVYRDKDTLSFSAPSECNPYSWVKNPETGLMECPSIQDGRARCRSRDEELCLYDGKFAQNTGSVFANLNAVFTLPYTIEGPLAYGEKPDPTTVYIAGIDFGKHDDSSVVSIFRLDNNHQVALLRIKGDYMAQLAAIDRLLAAYNPPQIYVEGREAGTVLSEMLRQRYGQRVIPVKWSRGGRWDKESSVVRAQDLFQSAGWRLLNVPWQFEEFRLFSKFPIGGGIKGAADIGTFVNHSGWRYEAPPGCHDDAVAAALYAAYGLPMVAPTLKRPSDPIEPWTPEFWDYLSKTQNRRNLGGGPFSLRKRKGF